jgi:hypothetical protein
VSARNMAAAVCRTVILVVELNCMLYGGVLLLTDA